MKYRQISFNNIYYIINKKSNESEYEFLTRCDYISKKTPKNKEQLEYFINLSFIQNNINFYGMSYSKEIMDLL